MDFEILKCKLKPETPDMTFINHERRSHGVEFEIKKPGVGVQKNVEKYCDVKVVKMTAPDEIETSELEKKSIKHDPELLQFAMDSWDLAVELKAIIETLKGESAQETEEAEKSTEKPKTTKQRKKAK